MRFRSILLALLGGNLLITAANLARDISFAAFLGATRESDILFLAISIPVFILTVSTNAFRSIAVPALGRAAASSTDNWRDWAKRLLWVGGSGTVAVAGCLAAIAGLTYVASIPGISTPSLQLLSLVLLAIVPMYVFAALVELIQGPMQISGRYLQPAVLRLGLPLGVIFGAIAFQELSVFGVALGGAIGALLGLLGALAVLRQQGILPTTRPASLPIPVGSELRAGYWALVSATCITYANPLVDQWVAGLAGEGGISMLGYANRLTTGIAALLSTTLSQALLVRFGIQVGAGDFHGIRDTYNRVIRVAPWIGCFATLSVWLTSDFVISLLYERGSFTSETSEQVSTLVDLYALQFPIFWTGIAAFTLIWALSMNRVFLRIGVVLFSLNVISDLVLVNIFGLNGIPLATSIVYLASVILLNVALRKVISLSPAILVGMVIPIGLLALCGLLINRFDLRISPAETFATLSSAVLVWLTFGVAGIWVAYSVWHAPAEPK